MLEASHIKIVDKQLNATQALQEIGELLVDVGSVDKQYIQNMIDSYEKLGPYFVIAPGIALAHAKPDASVIKDDVALVICKKPVLFHSHNDPVTLVFGICATSGKHHMEKIVDMANLLDDEKTIQKINEATSVNEIAQLINKP